MQKLLIYLSLIISAYAGCSTPQDKFSKLWLFTNYSGTADSAKTGIISSSFLLLTADGSFTKDFPVFQSGKWRYENDTLFMSSSGNTETYRVASDGTDLRIQTEQRAFVSFRSFPLKIENEDENPFSVKNNKWRMKAKARQTDSEIIARLLNHLQYWETYFTWASNNDLASIDVRSTATPIKIYSNGFEIKAVSQLPKAWKNLFYDEQEVIRANQLLEYAVKSYRIEWPKTDSKYKMFICVFRQLQNNVRTANRS